jgi:hypothetical protein
VIGCLPFKVETFSPDTLSQPHPALPW